MQPQTRAFVISKEPESLDRALHYARLAEVVCEPPSTPKVHTTFEQQLSHSDKNDFSVHAIQQLTQEVAQIRSKVDELANQRLNSTQREQFTNRSHVPIYSRNKAGNSMFNPSQRQSRTIICHRCGKPGHIQNNCFSKFHAQGYSLN